jgi:fructose-1,6-bisphosphatase/inositol monophosphatase family enzyme
MGADGSPTEEIDRAAERQILQSLEEEGVDWNVVSEEAGIIDRGGHRTLVVDPIDGTHNALRRLPSVSISLALGTENLAGIDLGVVHELSTGITYWAERGGGAFRDGRPMHARSWDARTELVFANLGRYARPHVLTWAGRARRVRALGCASLEMSLVAQGSGDAYLFDNAPDERNLRVTDIAAGYRILEEAGGGAMSTAFQPIGDLALDPQRHTSLLAWGDRRLVEKLRADGFG